jgi:hypothetical protein
MPARSRARPAFPLRRLALVLACLSSPAAAQGMEDGLPELNSLKPSSAPAFILLDVAPTAIERPQTPSDVAFSFVNQTQRFSTLPQNYAAEIAPFWLFPQPTLRWQDDVSRTLAQSFARTATLSFATAEVGTEDAPVAGLGAGVSVYLISGTMSPASQARMRQIEDYLARRDSVESELAKAQLASLQAEYGARIAAAAQAGNTALVTSLGSELAAKVEAARIAAQSDSVFARWEEDNPLEQLQEAMPQRVGLFWGVSGGAAWGYPDQVWERGRVRRVGVWSTLSYEGTPLTGSVMFTPVAVVRYLAQHGDSASSTVDAGTRLVLSAPTYSASVEGVVRLPMEDEDAENLYRIAGIFEYRVRPALWFTATFGRDYRSQASGSLLAQFGIKFHVTEDRYAPPVTTPGS